MLYSVYNDANILYLVYTSKYNIYLVLSIYIRYSSCRYNERQLIDVTVVRRVRQRAERSFRPRGTAGGREPVGLFFAIDLVVHLLPVGLYLDRQRYTVFWPYTEFESWILVSRSSGAPLGNLFVYRISGGFSFSRLIYDRTQIPSTFVTKNVGVPCWNKKGKQNQKHNVRTYRFLPADTRYIRIWYIIRTWYHTVVACDNNSGLPTPH